MRNQGETHDTSPHDYYESVLKTAEFLDFETTPPHSGFLRVVSWNIEKSKRWEALEACLKLEEVATADIFCLNEVDDGMARSTNRHVAFEIAKRLNMRAVYGRVFVEFTKGVGEERQAEGRNERGFQGNAILTRLPIRRVENVRLPICYDPFHTEEKRAGSRRALIVRTDQLAIVSTHLEDRTTPRCRSLQMKALLQAIGEGPAIVAGDWNTNTFARGSTWRTARSVIRMLATDVRPLVLDPTGREPLFKELKKAGFFWRGFNDDRPTATADLRSLDDKKYIPGIIRNMILRKMTHLTLRLDWIAGRGVRPLSNGRTLHELPAHPSDHLPIICDVVIESRR